MENRRADEEVELVTIGAGATMNKGSSPPTKRRRLTRVADKGGSSSSSFISTRSSAKSAAHTLATIAEVETAEIEEDEEPLVRKARKGKGTSSAEAETRAAAAKETEEVEEPPRHKVHKAKVPFYYDKKAFTVSATSRFVKQLEKENWKEFMSFVKDNVDPAEPTVDGSATLGVIETNLGPPESQETREMVPVQDSRPDVVVTEPIPQLELRPDVVVEKKSKNSSIGKMAPKFLIKSRTQRYVKQAKV